MLAFNLSCQLVNSSPKKLFFAKIQKKRKYVTLVIKNFVAQRFFFFSAFFLVMKETYSVQHKNPTNNDTFMCHFLWETLKMEWQMAPTHPYTIYHSTFRFSDHPQKTTMFFFLFIFFFLQEIAKKSVVYIYIFYYFVSHSRGNWTTPTETLTPRPIEL